MTPHSTLFAGELRALDLDLDDVDELDDTDLLPLEDADVVTLLRALDPFQACTEART